MLLYTFMHLNVTVYILHVTVYIYAFKCYCIHFMHLKYESYIHSRVQKARIAHIALV